MEISKHLGVHTEKGVLPEHGPVDPPKPHMCVLCNCKYTGEHTCDTCGGLCHKVKRGTCWGCPHRKDKSTESVEDSVGHDLAGSDDDTSEDL